MIYLLPSVIVATFAVTYAADVSFSYKYLEDKDLIEIEISTDVIGTEESNYVAVAFALEPKMMDADGYYCTGQNMKSFSILQEFKEPYEYQHPGLASLVSTGVMNGKLRCKFRRPVAVLRPTSFTDTYLFDLSKRSFNVLVAHGLTAAGKMTYHGWGNAKVLPEKLIITRPNAVTATTCGSDKACITEPAGCSLNDPKCVFFSLQQENNKVIVELSGGIGIGRQYVAVAFSRHHEMRDADLYYCDGVKLTSGVIRELTKTPIDLADRYVNVTMAATINGVGQCRFSRDLCVTKDVSNGTSEQFDFGTNPYHILYAHGNTTRDGELSYHGIHGRGLTPSAVPLANGSNIQYQCVTIPSTPIPVTDPTDGRSKTVPVTTTSKASVICPSMIFVIFAMFGSIILR